MKKVTEKELKNRGDFSDQLDCIFDTACPDWEKRIKQDRLKDVDEKEEDFTFFKIRGMIADFFWESSVLIIERFLLTR